MGYPKGSTSIPNLRTVQGVWTGGGAAADCTVASGDWNRGITSIAYTAATGCYTVTFNAGDCGYAIVDWHISTGQQTGVNPLAFCLRNAGFSASARTAIFEVSASDSGTLTDLLTTDKLYVSFTFAKTPPGASN
ncbi:hypothetical protein [Acidithiobacillus sp.]|uniref:hypothetical protein n=1 Tax=Acidithiobacillus sp. TaxID=1872118 RepID=UPI0025893867|nr:hypothetical protein [Acidithiobacillus sp.]MDD5374479.1 hypothetical protein [Acidithiobacillus sp.]